MMVNNTSENVGIYWYLYIEMFPDKLPFMKQSMLLLQLTMCVLISIHMDKAFTALEIANPKNVQPKRQKLLMNGVLLISFVKLIMNQYPCMDDLSMTLFLTAVNVRFVIKNVGALTLFLFGTVYAIINSAFMWVTWLKRFSGNANFFYFQTLVMQSFLVLFFIQIYIAVDGKRQKFARMIK
jgi:hypothetical protein